MRNRIGLILFALLLMGVNVHAQSVWEIALVVQGEVLAGDFSVRLVQMTPDGVTQTPLTAPLTPALLTDAALSPDGRYAAATFQGFMSDETLPAYLYDLTTGAVLTIDNPSGISSGTMQIGGFSPDSTRLALSYVGVDYAMTDNPFAGGAFTVEAATGVIDALAPMTVLNPSLPFEGIWVLMGEWGADGVQVYPSCFACEPAFEGEYALWNPDTNAIIANAGAFFSFPFADALDGTGEILYVGRDDTYPGDPLPGRFPKPNVVRYFADGVLPQSDQIARSPVIYFNRDDISIEGRARWVNDGRAFLITSSNGDESFWVSRDGLQTALTLPIGSEFLAGTPDGWVSATPSDPNNPQGAQTIVAYTDEVAGEPIGTVGHYQTFIVVRKPALGLVEALMPLRPVLPPPPEAFAAILAANMPTCPGMAPSRLLPGGMARVTPGNANRLRVAPSTSADIIGSIPGGAVFIVIAGPVCDLEFAWWQVNYDGETGYTAELRYEQYYVESMQP
ncbi:MAG: SH3 domain-containing protein [Chloroflexota bacterium]|nr:SH3 domain-containing protein [Chloroflexota bacterium]